jgi:hypothetical protein
MGEVLCNNDNCLHNRGRSCTAKQIGIVDNLCVSRRKVKKQDSYQQLMHQPFNPNCRPSQNGYKATHAKVFK